MKNLSRKTNALLMLCLLVISAMSALLAGCGKKEETASTVNSNYYTGPLPTTKKGNVPMKGGEKAE